MFLFVTFKMSLKFISYEHFRVTFLSVSEELISNVAGITFGIVHIIHWLIFVVVMTLIDLFAKNAQTVLFGVNYNRKCLWFNKGHQAPHKPLHLMELIEVRIF